MKDFGATNDHSCEKSHSCTQESDSSSNLYKFCINDGIAYIASTASQRIQSAALLVSIICCKVLCTCRDNEVELFITKNVQSHENRWVELFAQPSDEQKNSCLERSHLEGDKDFRSTAHDSK